MGQGMIPVPIWKGHVIICLSHILAMTEINEEFMFSHQNKNKINNV
jgi:hypothetical protein